MERALDLVCVGRAAVDLYGEQIGAPLEQVRTFARYLGGSPANTAVGGARLGLKTAMLTRVGDEQNGRFVRDTLAAEGVDVSRVKTDRERLTALVFLAIRDAEHFPLLFYRERCADMALDVSDVDAGFVASARALLISGTHLSQPGPHAACRAAIEAARAAGTKVVLDIDYRPVLWGLAELGAGERRYVPSDSVSARLQSVVPDCDLVVGTEEEIRIAGGSGDTVAALRRLRELSAATLVVKRGPHGCVVFDGVISDRLDDGVQGPGFAIEVFNVLGAGDAFMAGFLRGWLRGEPLSRCCEWANACGALVVSRHGCAPAMPSWIELQHFLTHGASSPRLRDDAALERLHRATTRTARWPALAVLAFDHRTQFDELARAHGAPPERIGAFKALVARAARRTAGNGVIVDERHGAALLSEFADAGWWVARPVEAPGSRPRAIDGGRAPALALRSWPTAQVAKCLVLWHPDDPAALRDAQARSLAELQDACIASEREWLVEPVPPRDTRGGDETLARTLEQLYGYGLKPDWWKLPPPASTSAWHAIEAAIERHDPHCRGVLLLGFEASEDDLQRAFALAAPHARCRGFAVGRSIFAASAAAWFAGRAGDEQVVEDIAARYARLIEHWRRNRP
jgi:5-dehydro-2-deoxygluconokinase